MPYNCKYCFKQYNKSTRPKATKMHESGECLKPKKVTSGYIVVLNGKKYMRGDINGKCYCVPAW